MDFLTTLFETPSIFASRTLVSAKTTPFVRVRRNIWFTFRKDTQKATTSCLTPVDLELPMSQSFQENIHSTLKSIAQIAMQLSMSRVRQLNGTAQLAHSYHSTQCQLQSRDLAPFSKIDDDTAATTLSWL